MGAQRGERKGDARSDDMQWERRRRCALEENAHIYVRRGAGAASGATYHHEDMEFMCHAIYCATHNAYKKTLKKEESAPNHRRGLMATSAVKPRVPRQVLHPYCY